VLKMDYKSQIGQDRFVTEVLNNKLNGYFVDIGAGHPKEINNTFYLEKKLGWNGLSIDMGPENEFCHIEAGTTKHEFLNLWETTRSSEFVCGNALKLDYEKLFDERSVPETIDYLSIDLEPADITYECLLKIPFEKYKFKIVTFEHDLYRDPENNIKYLNGARDFLKKFNLVPLNVKKFLKSCGYDTHRISIQEDWFLNVELLKKDSKLKVL